MKKFECVFRAAACLSILFAGGCGEGEKREERTEKRASVSVSAAVAEPDHDAAMNCFKSFRKAVIDNDTVALLSHVDGELLQRLKQQAISNDLRKSIIAVKAAYEDLYIRRSNPSEALICAFFDKKGVEQRMDVKIRLNENQAYKIIDISSAPHTPVPYLEQFFAVCATGDQQTFAASVTPEFREQYGEIPAGLKTEADNKITFSGNFSGGENAEMRVSRSGLAGTVSLKKADFIWKVSAMDSVFAAPMPSSAVRDFCAAVSGKQSDAVGKLATKEFVKKEKPEQSQELISRLASVKVVSEKISGSSAEVAASFDSKKEQGNIIFRLTSEGEGWLVSNVRFSDVRKKEPPAPAGNNPTAG